VTPALQSSIITDSPDQSLGRAPARSMRPPDAFS